MSAKLRVIADIPIDNSGDAGTLTHYRLLPRIHVHASPVRICIRPGGFERVVRQKHGAHRSERSRGARRHQIGFPAR